MILHIYIYIYTHICTYTYIITLYYFIFHVTLFLFILSCYNRRGERRRRAAARGRRGPTVLQLGSYFEIKNSQAAFSKLTLRGGHSKTSQEEEAAEDDGADLAGFVVNEDEAGGEILDNIIWYNIK